MLPNKFCKPSNPIHSSPSAQTSGNYGSRHNNKLFFIPSKFMSPLSFINPELHYNKKHEPYPRDLAKKYLGKKAVCVRYPTEIKSAYRHFKLIQEIELNKEKCVKSGFRCLGDRIILERDIHLSQFQRRKILSPYLKKITFIKDTNLQLLRYTRNIRDLTLMLDRKQIPRVQRTICQAWPHLESFYFKKDGYYDQPFKGTQDYLEFFRDLIQLRSLKVISLNFRHDTMESDFLAQLVQLLEQVDTFRWYLKARVDRVALSNQIPASGILKKIDFLGLKMSGKLDCDPYALVPAGLSKLKDITSQKKKVLYLSFSTRNQERIDLNELLAHCAALEGIYIKSFGDTFTWVANDNSLEEQLAEIEEEEEKAMWAYGLKDVVLNLSNPSEEAFEILLEVINKKSRNIRSLNIFCCNSVDDVQVDYYTYERQDIFHSCSRWLEDMTSLESLELSSGDFEEDLQCMLLGMRSLKKFTYHLYAGKLSKPWDESFPYEGLLQVKEIKLVIHSDMKIVAWGKRFIEELAKLQNLEVLEIIDKTKQEISLSAFYGLLTALCQLKKLRKVVLHSKVSRERDYDGLEYLLSAEAQRQFSEWRRTIFEDVTKRVNQLIEMNKDMEEIEIKEINCFNIISLRYKKK